MTTQPVIFNVMDYGAVGDNSTDDTTAIQNCINAAQAVFPVYGAAGGEVYVPPGLTFKVAGHLSISYPITVKFRSFINYTPTSGVCLTIGASGWAQNYDLEFVGLINSTGNSSMPTGWNGSGTTGIQVNNMCFSRLKVNVVQGFTRDGIYLDGLGDVFSPQVIQHNRMDFYQVVNNGCGIRFTSAGAATSSVEANFVHISDLYQSFVGFQFDDGSHSASTSNYLLIDALDNANTGSGGQGGEIFGSFNRIDITYLGTNIWFGGSASHNTLNVYNTAATGASYTSGGTSNSYNIKA